MINHIYNLPTLEFIGGESQTFRFTLYRENGTPFDASGCDVDFSLINYSNKNGTPVMFKSATTQQNANGVLNIAVVDLLPDETVELYGKYVYQITIKDSYDGTDIPGQGIMVITRNIHKGFII